MHNSKQTACCIKQLAKEKHVSISTMLTECGMNKDALYTMRSKGFYPRVEAIVKIADYLNCSVDYLLGRTDVREVNKKSSTFSDYLDIAAQGGKTTRPAKITDTETT